MKQDKPKLKFRKELEDMTLQSLYVKTISYRQNL